MHPKECELAHYLQVKTPWNCFSYLRLSIITRGRIRYVDIYKLIYLRSCGAFHTIWIRTGPILRLEYRIPTSTLLTLLIVFTTPYIITLELLKEPKPEQWWSTPSMSGTVMLAQVVTNIDWNIFHWSIVKLIL